tara:strand:- start:495 stop:1100 length:606 start_codon:yes stop_codon:yes gene_type:complete
MVQNVPMSIQALSWSIKQQTSNPTTKLVLILLANYCDEKHSCYPSEKHLANLVGVSDRTIRRCLKELVDKKLISVQAREGTSNRYFVRVDTSVQTVRTPTTNNTKDKTKDKYTDDFEKFWNLYPRKVNKYATLQKFKVVLKNYDLDKLLKATFNFAQQTKIDKTEEKFIPHATTWLSQKRYKDFEGSIKITKMKSANQIAG